MAFADVSKFDPVAARQKFEQNHPDAVKDVEEARAMAIAGDSIRTVRKEFRDRVADEIASGKKDERLVVKGAALNFLDEWAENSENYASEEYRASKKKQAK